MKDVTAAAVAAAEVGYSKAFDNFVRSDDDVVGLLAYALFKRSVREEAERGRRTSGDTRDPPPTVVQTYRLAAQQTFSEVLAENIEAAKSEIQQSAALSAIEITELKLFPKLIVEPHLAQPCSLA